MKLDYLRILKSQILCVEFHFQFILFLDHQSEMTTVVENDVESLKKGNTSGQVSVCVCLRHSIYQYGLLF